MAEGVDGSQRPRRWPAGRRDGRHPGRARPHTVLGLRRPPPAGAVRWMGCNASRAAQPPEQRRCSLSHLIFYVPKTTKYSVLSMQKSENTG